MKYAMRFYEIGVFRVNMHKIIIAVLFLQPVIGTATADGFSISNNTFIQEVSDMQTKALQFEAAPSAPFIDENGMECELITFEGIGDNQRIGTVPGQTDTIFGNSWLGLVDYDAGGNGNFANEPSPSTAAYYLDQNDISIQFAKGVQIVEFQYSAAKQSLPVHIIAYDENDNLVDDNIGNAVGTDYDGALCVGDPSGNFCDWGTLTLSSNAKNIKRVQINGTVSNLFGIDNLKVCNGACSPPEGQSAKFEPISDYGQCPPMGAKVPTWGAFGPRAVLEADSGEKLEVTCGSDEGFEVFILWYTPPGGDKLKVGLCPFYGGCNTASFMHSGDNNNNGNPDCFIRTRWISRDYGDNDKPNAWTGEDDFPLENTEPPYVDLLDWAESIYEVNTDSLTKFSRKYEYNIGPPVIGCTASGEPEGDLFEVMPITNDFIDPPLGPETEAFFNSVIQQLQDVPQDLGPMEEDTTAPCDFDRNGRCDEQDRDKLLTHIGSCDGELGYHPIADADGNGCLTVEDEIALFGRNNSPTANAGIDKLLECTETGGTLVILDGSDSTDLDGDSLFYTWTGIFGELTGEMVTASLPLGTHTITLTVDDGNGGTDSDTVDITVHDTVPPELSVSVSPDTLWQPNHKLHDISATVSSSDICDANPSIVLSSVVSNEPDNGLGDGDTANDIQGVDIGIYDLSFMLRAERSGKGIGRVYTIEYSAKDASYNAATQSATVVVPHSQ